MDKNMVNPQTSSTEAKTNQQSTTPPLTMHSSRQKKLLIIFGVIVIILIAAGVGIKTLWPTSTIDQAEKLQEKITKSELPGLPPDPGEAGKATLEGIDSDNDGVRDDVQRYIELTVTDSARHREALRSVARVTQRELLAQTKEEAIQLSIEGIRTIECLVYLGVLEQNKFEEVMALMLNTEIRLLAMETHKDRITGQVFTSLPESLLRSACTFDVEALPN